MYVVDTNVVLSALLNKGKPFQLFKRASLDMIELVAPEFLYFEIGQRVNAVLACSGYDRDDFIDVFAFIKDSLDLYPLSAFRSAKPTAREISPDEDDVPFVALALYLDCLLITGDTALLGLDEAVSPAEVLQDLQ